MPRLRAVPSVFGGFIQLLQVDKTRAKFLFTLIIFFVLLIFIGIAPHCGHCCKGCSLSLVTTNIQQLLSVLSSYPIERAGITIPALALRAT